VVLRYKTEFKDIDGIMSVERVGSIYYLIVKNYGDEIKKQLEAMGAEIVEEVGMSLEEIFIYSTKAQDGL
jgi:ABC-2 type transport system ATP-binding protein